MDKKIIKQTARAYYNLLPFMRKTENAFAKFEAIFGSCGITQQKADICHLERLRQSPILD